MNESRRCAAFLSILMLCACAGNQAKSAGAAYSSAMTLSNAGGCTDAIPLFGEAIEKRRAFLEAYDGLSRCEEVLGSYHQAAQIATSGLAIDPANAELYQVRSDIEFNEGTYQGTLAKAVSDEVRSAQFVPRTAAAYLAIASKLSDMTAYSEAVKMTDRALPLVTDKSPIYILRGSYYLEGNDLKKALRDFRLAERTARTKDAISDAYAHESLAYLQAHLLDKAEETILTAFKQFPTSYSYAMYAARVYHEAMRPKDAYAMANRAVSLATDPEEAANARKARADEAVRLGGKAAPLADYNWILANSANYLLKVSVAKLINGLDLQR